MKLSFMTDNKLQVNQFKRKILANFNKALFFQKWSIFYNQIDQNLSSKETRHNSSDLLIKPTGPINTEF